MQENANYLDSIAGENSHERILARLKTELHKSAAQFLRDLVHFGVLEPLVRLVGARLPTQVVAVVFREENNFVIRVVKEG